MKGNSRKLLSVLLSILMVTSVFFVDASVFAASAAEKTIGQNTQAHVVSSYASAYAGYKPSYLNGFATPLDGTNGNPDMVIPGLNKTDDMVPQGLAFYPKKNWVLVTSYIGSNATTSNYIYIFPSLRSAMVIL